ncbi:uncharacterized protein LOC109724921 isoform X1 [Ananas comosus]|uniref:Uncharacterized protein LOC109724921 isoform X1 n=2 Tax=Ananas comosus TaxID=4615 RepID=A0A6P5GUD8_ANACO|nr:uncharacterized protein LOC109724921 isoform X1 [Ananas comosus]CAD1832098.1 unnamed protein product [Ananas comosus var. bracteatus]
MACDEVVVLVGDEGKRRTTTTTTTTTTPLETLASDALLFATMCVVGLPVEVQVRDGSLFSGVFHTASLDKGFGVVLKKARKIGRGKYDSNVALGDFVDTLVVKSGDLVQVVVKEFLLPAEGIGANISGGGVEATAGIAATQNCDEDVKLGAKSFTSDAVSSAGKLDQNERLIITEDAKVGEELGVPGRQSESMDQMRNDIQDRKCLEKAEVPSSVSNNAVMGRQVGKYNTKEESDHIYEMGHEVYHLKPSSNMNREKSDGPANLATKSSEASNPKKNLLGKFGAKESKLNPNAEVFSPSYSNSKSAAAAVPIVLNQTYISNSVPAMPNGYLPSAFEVNHFPSRKMVPYNNLVPGNSAIGTHFARPVAGHAAGMLEPVRVGARYQTVQVGPTYINPNPQPEMAARVGQFVYMHPVSPDAIQGNVISQGLPPPMLNPYQLSMQKLQGTVPPLCVTPPLLNGGNQHLMVPSRMPFSQPFPAIRPIVVPNGNGIFTG